MNPELQRSLQTMQLRSSQLSSFLQGKTYDDYEQSEMLRRAVEHCCWGIGKLIEKARGISADAAKRADTTIYLSGFDLGFADRLVTEYET